MAGNDHLVTVLERLIDSHDVQDKWVRLESGFDDESKRIMLDLLSGQRECAGEFLVWVKGLSIELPASLVVDESMPESWHMKWDGQRCSGMEDQDYDMLDAMQYILFSGETYRADNAVVQRMLGKGIPDRLRQDVGKS
jgi:hypothetical protein